MDKSGAPDARSCDAQSSERQSWRFLYRTDAGEVDARTWRRGAWPLAALAAVLTLFLVFIFPYTAHDLKQSPLLSATALGANLYVVLYSFLLILIGICYYNLSAKRWRDLKRPAALAGLVPFCALLAGAAHWLAARGGEIVPQAVPLVADTCLILVVIWNVAELAGLIFLRAPRN
jgi:uncharacterized membrane protein YhaH (DUF805 family)